MKTLMVPIDGSALSERALPHAARLAGALGGKLILLRATYAHWLEQPTQAELAAIVEKVPAEGFEIATEIYRVYHDDMARAICEAAVERQADLIVMSTH